MTPIDFEILRATWEMCGFQDRCSSRTTPRKTVSLTCSILCSFMHICVGKWYLFGPSLNNLELSFPFCLRTYSRKYRIKLVATCFATVLQNEWNSEVARFTIHLKPVLQPTSFPGSLSERTLGTRLMQKVQSSSTFCSKLCTCLLAFLQQVT